MEPTSRKLALLDTTIQVDRCKMATRRKTIEELLQAYDFVISTGISLLEFKATLIQECITIHDFLKRVGLYTKVRDRLTESSHRQAKLRGHIFNNIISISGQSSFVITEEKDRRLAERARLLLATKIPRLYDWFCASVGSVQTLDIQCTRAKERPAIKGVAFEPNLPKCRMGNKFCKVEEFIRKAAAPIIESVAAKVEAMNSEDAQQLRGTIEVFRSVLDKDAKLSHSECRRAGDMLIALEGVASGATHSLSTNARDWSVVSEVTGLEFQRVKYADG
jgi:hypothetical protein